MHAIVQRPRRSSVLGPSLKVILYRLVDRSSSVMHQTLGRRAAAVTAVYRKRRVPAILPSISPCSHSWSCRLEEAWPEEEEEEEQAARWIDQYNRWAICNGRLAGEHCMHCRVGWSE